jgi:hypothetical protein
MTEFNINEPLWVGMDVDAELAHYRQEDRRRMRAERALALRASLGRALRALLSLIGKEGSAPQFPRVA